MVCNVAYRATNSDADHTATIVGIALVALTLGVLGFLTVRATAAWVRES